MTFEASMISRDYSHELLAEIVSSSSRWISSADSKASGIIALSGVLIGLDLVGGQQPERNDLLRVCFAIVAGLAAVSALVALWPRTNRKRLLKSRSMEDGVSTNSLTVFGEIGRLSFSEFCVLIGDVTEKRMHQ